MWEHASTQEDVTKASDECRGRASTAPAGRVWGSFASAGSVSRPLLGPGDAPSGPPPGRGAPSGGGTLPAEGAAAAAAAPPGAAAREAVPAIDCGHWGEDSLFEINQGGTKMTTF